MPKTYRPKKIVKLRCSKQRAHKKILFSSYRKKGVNYCSTHTTRLSTRQNPWITTLPWPQLFATSTLDDENHKAFKDPLHVPVGPITKARSKKIKEAFNGLIQEIWANSNTGHSKLDPKEVEGVINLIQTIEGWSALIGRDLWRGLMADWLSNPILVNSHFSYSETYYFRPNPP